MDTTDWKYFSLCLCWRSFLVALLVCGSGGSFLSVPHSAYMYVFLYQYTI